MKERIMPSLIVALYSFLLFMLVFCNCGPSKEQKRWSLATTGVLTEFNRERHDILGGEEQSEEGVIRQKKLLSDWWGVDCREDLFFVLDWLEQVGHRKRFEEMGQYMKKLSEADFRAMLSGLVQEDSSSWETVLRYWFWLGRKSILGWDFCRYIHLCRKGYYLGYLSENEAWRMIMPKARVLQETFDSWKDLGENYLVGREFWSLERTKESGRYFHQAFKKLLEDPDSPWNTIPWDLNLK
jgi:hypothetical protein